MRALLVVNPKATATTERMRDVLSHALASEMHLEVVQTKARGHATELGRRAAAEELDVVVALGGDGTVNEVVNGLLTDGPGTDGPALAVVPGGSTNVFARALGMANSAVEATSQLLDALRSERRRSIGLGRADEQYFTFCAGLGMDAEVVRRVELKRADGRRATPGLFVRTGFHHFFRDAERRDLQLTVSAPRLEPERIGVGLVCNTSPWTFLGVRPVRPCPDASFDTGLDLFGLRKMGALSTLHHLRQILAADPRPRGRRVLALHDQTEFTISAASPQPLQVDGDPLGDRRSVTFRAVPNALRVVV
jgi:diacylglycerol kinase family enzyme